MIQLEDAGTPKNLKLPLKVSRQPGNASCLDTEEFLVDHCVPFESISVLDDEEVYMEPEPLCIDLPIPKNMWDNERSFEERSYSDTAETWKTAKTG